MSIKIAINGAGGRMGRRLMDLTCADSDLELTAAVDAPGSPVIG
ncbi:MAG: 4-hydroxy-tetrahydrodipicolinate reductase, partial [Planctomycetota bacterium]